MGFWDQWKKRRLVGIDVGMSGIKAVELQMGKRPRLISYNRVNLPWEAIGSDGAISDPQAVSEALRSLFESSTFSSRKVAVGASGASVFTKRVRMPRMKEVELREQISFEAEQYLPFSADEVNLDFAILGPVPQTNQMEVLLVAIKKDFARNWETIAKQAGLELAVLDIQPFALGNVFEFNYAENKELPVGVVTLLLDFGAGAIKLSAVEKDKTTFTREILAGGMVCSQLIAEAMEIPLDEAEYHKIHHPSADGVKAAVAAYVQHATDQVARAIEVYLSGEGDVVIDGLYICGGASQTPGLKDSLEKQLGYSVHTLNAVRNIAGSGAKMNPEAIEELSYLGAVAMGLSLRSEGDS